MYFKIEFQGLSEWECRILQGSTSFSAPCEQRVTSSCHMSPSQQDPTLPESPEVLALRTLCPWVQSSVPFPKVVERPPAHRSGEALAASRARLLNSSPSAPKHISGINPDPVPPRDGLLPPPTGTGSSEPVEAPATGDWSHCLTASLASEASGPSLVPPSCSEERGQARGRRAACRRHLACHTWAQPVLAAEINQPFQRRRRRGALSQSQPEVLSKAPEGKEGSRVLLRGSTSTQSPPTSQTTISGPGAPRSPVL